MSKGDWIDNVRRAIIEKSGIYIRSDSQLEEIERHASAKFGLKRIIKSKNDSATHYAKKLIKHFDLPLKEPKRFKTSKSHREDAMQKRGANNPVRGSFGKASAVRHIELTGEEKEKYLLLLDQLK